MGISPNLLAAILRYANTFYGWLSVATGYWQTGATWNKGTAPDASTAQAIHIENYTVSDDTSLSNKQNKTINVSSSGVFNPLNSTYAYGNSSVNCGGMLTGTTTTLRDNSTLLFSYSNSDVNGNVIVAGNTNIKLAFQGVFSGHGLTNLGGAGTCNIYGDGPSTDSGYYVYPRIGTLSCTDNLSFVAQNSYLGTVAGNLNLLVNTAINVPSGKTLSFRGANGSQYIEIQSGCSCNIQGTLQAGSHQYNTQVNIQCPVANLTGGGTIDVGHSDLYLNTPSYDYANIGSNISFLSGGLAFANMPSSGYSVDTNITWKVISPGSIYVATGGLNPTITIKEVIGTDDGTHSSGFNSNESTGLFTAHIRTLTIESTMTQFQFYSAYNPTHNLYILDAISSCPVGCTIYMLAPINITNSITIAGSVFSSASGSVINIPSGKTFTMKNLIIDYSTHATGTFTANTLGGFTGTGTVIITG